MIKFDKSRLPSKVYIGYMSYEARPYIPPPLRCFKCQKYGHVAAICKGKQRCGRCAGKHEYGKCGGGVKFKCCNCGGEHSSAYHGCEASKKAAEVQQVKTLQGITYAEAVKKVSGERKGYKPENKDRPCGSCEKIAVSVLTTLERRFNLQSADVGVIASSFEIGNLALILFVSYFGARAHRPRLIGCGGIVMALGALLSALPEFLTNQYEYKSTKVWRKEPGRDMCSNMSRRDVDDGGLCSNKANTNMMYLLLIGAQVLLGIGATPVQPLGVSYIDDHVQKKDSSLYIGILFSTLVFGPACGFILGSVCTKFYVDAVFVDTRSQGTWSLSQGASGTRWDTPWTGCQSIAGHNHTHVHTTIHTLWTCQSAYPACLWTGGGNRSTWRKPTQHGENTQTLCTQGSGGNQMPNPGAKLDITPDDPRWIGAWWGGFLLCGALLFFSAIFMFGFPSSLSERYGNSRTQSDQPMLPVSQSYEHSKPSNGVLHNHQPDSSCCEQLRVIPKVTKHLLSNPVFTCIVLAACMEIAVVAGFAAFLGKYLEQQFNLTTTSANQLLGMTAIPCACLGIFMGGLLVKKLNLCALGAVRMAMLVNLISTACYVSFLFLGCDTGPVAGVTVTYGNETLQPGQTPEAPCISECNCYTSSVSPVCGSNGVTYLSSCFAGCTRSISTGVLPRPAQNLTGCACISGDGIPSTVVPGKCPSPGCQEAFLIFLCVICACSMIGAMAQTPSVIILIRTVSPELKSYALGVLFLLLRLLGFIPPPLIFGVGIDSTCLFWSSECDTKGACVLYDNVAYRHLYVSLAIVLKIIAFLLYTTTWQCLRCNYKKYIKNNEAYVTSTEIFSSDVNLDSLGKDINRTKFIYNLEDHEWCENMESVL
ncbi:solute carrier organic anion transporter family member 3A1 isoform X2 [Ictalurus furcatus]|uniref:solute carrier organic anion transporter family member 3A1 isoform X2 n=1 Tax=Ictalurus furcatus TaxID=66913 RepID=UPI002350B10F|nr:solute carrier organic anion transporter family member 3A1 isoform X2 [Ictalurus furcatus]